MLYTEQASRLTSHKSLESSARSKTLIKKFRVTCERRAVIRICRSRGNLPSLLTARLGASAVTLQQMHAYTRDPSVWPAINLGSSSNDSRLFGFLAVQPRSCWKTDLATEHKGKTVSCKPINFLPWSSNRSPYIMSSLPFNLVAAKPIIFIISFSISAIKQKPIHFITGK